MQVADRWHLLKNLREALEGLLRRQLQRKRQRLMQRLCPSVANEIELNDFIERSRVRLLPHLLSGKRKKRGQSIRPPPMRLPSAQEVAWMLLLPEKLDDAQRSTAERLCKLFPQIERAKEWLV